jgi:hypothetical protein
MVIIKPISICINKYNTHLLVTVHVIYLEVERGNHMRKRKI